MANNRFKTRLDSLKIGFRQKSTSFFSCTDFPDETHSKGLYGFLYGKPNKAISSILGVSREILVVFTTFREQQFRTIETLSSCIGKSNGRLEPTYSIVVHDDPQGDQKLRNWGKDRGFTILPVYGNKLLSPDFALDAHFRYELYSHDPFDVTGPVFDDFNFFGRRNEAMELARKLQLGQVRSCLGIRKIGKTSLVNRVIHNSQTHFDCHCLLVDCSGDGIWKSSAAALLESIALSISTLIDNGTHYLAISNTRGISQEIDIALSTSHAIDAIKLSTKPVVVFFDEADYISPSSPTRPEYWKSVFNAFWRNARHFYQESIRIQKQLSFLISGVSSKWFNVGTIDGIENAALAMVPEEYLSPMPRKATQSMITKLSNRAGLRFSTTAINEISFAGGDLPYWCRKICSYVHRSIGGDERPCDVADAKISQLIDSFLSGEGGSISRVALAHLFGVFPELQNTAITCLNSELRPPDDYNCTLLKRYGVLDHKGVPSGAMMRRGLELVTQGADAVEQSSSNEVALEETDNIEWAEELASIGKRRNLLERSIRLLVIGQMRSESIANKDKSKPKDRILAALPEKKRNKLKFVSSVEDLVDKLTWLELFSIIKREWYLFERVFGDKHTFDKHMEIVNDRPDAHAKPFDSADIALQRRSLTTIEEAINSLG